MKLTCLSMGKGYHFPPCHIIEIGGFHILVDCPLDLSALLIFAPIPAYSSGKIEEPFDCSCLECVSTSCDKQKVDNSGSLIHQVPWYKTVSSLYLWDVSFIDVVLITSPMGMLGLPFLTQNKNFSAQIYASEASARIGKLMMEDLVSMNREFRQFYGPEDSRCAQWMKWEELEKFSPAVQEIILGKDGAELGGWLALYSAADVKDCIEKVQMLKYAEETCYGGLLVIKAVSSGLDIGTSNWEIRSPETDAAFISSSVFTSAPALNFDYHAFQDHDIIVFSDFSCLDNMQGNEVETDDLAPTNESVDVANIQYLGDSEETIEEDQKLSFICLCATDSIKAGGSVLIPTGRIGVVLQMLEHLSSSEEFLNLKVPIFFISSVAEELLSYTSVIPEWLCLQRQKKLFSCEPLFAHADLVKEKKFYFLSSMGSADFLKIWQEPCIVFAPHWSLRLGPAIHLLQHLRGNENSLLIMERGLDAALALLPFKPMAMKVLQCSFLSGIKSSKIPLLIKKLQPKCLLLPADLKTVISNTKLNSVSVICYDESVPLHIPSQKKSAEVEISIDVASQLQWISLKDDTNITRLKGELSIENGKYRLLMGVECKETYIDSGRLLTLLQSIGLRTSMKQPTSDGSAKSFVLLVHEPSEALIEVGPTRTLISTSNSDVASSIARAVDSFLSEI